MKKNFQNTAFFLSLLIGLFSTPPAVAQQKSDYSPLVRQGYSGYKDVYSPNAGNVSYHAGSAVLNTSHADVGLNKIKFFIPPGTKKFFVSFLTYASPQESKAAARFNAVPASTIADVTASTSVQQTRDTLKKLIGGDELRFYSPGGSGGLGISAPDQFDSFQTDKGGYIYLSVLSVPANKIYTLTSIVNIDEACYRSWYANAQWDAQGNPDENATHTCSGSTGGGTETPPLENIQLSPDTWSAATDEARPTIKVTPLPIGAQLPITPTACTATPANLLTLGPASATEAEFTVNSIAIINPNTKVTIDCGGKTAELTLQPKELTLSGIVLSHSMVDNQTIITTKPHPAGAKLPTCTGSQNLDSKDLSETTAQFILNTATPVATDPPVTVTVDCGDNKKASLTLYPNSGQIEDKNSTTDANGNFLLNFKLKRPNSELSGTSNTNFWIAAVVLRDEFFFFEDTRFFYTPAGWKKVNDSFSLSSLAYQFNQTPAAKTSFTISTGVPQMDFENLNAELHFAYRGGDGILKNMGAIWKKY